MRTVIIGQSRSGKSALLASLHFAALRSAYHGHAWYRNIFPGRRTAGADRGRLRGYEVLCHNLNDPFSRLSTDFARILENGSIAEKASEDVLVHELDLAIRRPWVPWDFVGKTHSPRWLGSVSKIEMPDGPGEALFAEGGGVMEEMRAILIDHLRVTEGLILCLPPPSGDDEDRSAERTFFRFLHNLVTEIARGTQRLPWKNIAIVFTKSDHLFYSHGHLALQELRRQSTADKLRQRLRQSQFNDVLVNQIRIATKNQVRIAAGFSSIYGFTSGNTANYDPDMGGLLINPANYSADEVDANWRPFQILDPFLFATSGMLVANDPEAGPGFQRIV